MLWQLQAADISELRVRRDEAEYRLIHDKQAWKIAGPFDASAVADLVQPMTEESRLLPPGDGVQKSPKPVRYSSHS